MAWQPPPRFEEYELGESLGRGRSGQVYLARDNLLERTVAVKFLPFADAALPARFLIEARAAARIQHPNVATLYRIGQLPGCAFLVWELVRGRSLDQLERPAAHELVLGIARDAARGLAAAHRRGVVHRDIKLANLVLAETGEAKLVDFGLAALVTPPDGRSSPTGDVAAAASEPRLVGTPYFRAPELWRGEPADARSDLYALGLVLYELLAGDGPFRDLSIGELAEAVQHTPARPLQVAAPGVPDGLAALVDRCLHTDRDARFATADDVVAALELLARGRGRAAVPDGNPYRGLRAYEAEHRVVFFGRARPLQLAIERLRAEPMLVVIGDSGVGKSSLCSAAVLPAVSDGALEDGRRWMIARMVPGREPLRQLIGALAALTSLAAPDLGAAVARSPRDVARIARGALRAEQGWLLYVDQMEELVTHATADTHAASEVLAALADGVPGVRVLATARSDFLSRLAVLPGLVERLPPALMLLAPMTATDVREAIVGPAAICGTRFESEPLVDELVASTEGAQGSLPLLQFTLAELWERRDRAAQAISAASLASIGGVAGALANHADGVLVSLSTEERAVARAVFLRLVTVDDTRARRTDDELHALSPLAPRVVAALVRGRLLVASESPDGTVYEIAHEALVHGWGTLARWLAEDVEVRAGRHRLESAAAEWQRVGRRRDLLWSARQLDETDARAFDELAPRERAFADASRRASAIARWLRRAGVVAAALAIGGAWLGARIQQRNTTDREIAEDVALATRSSDAARAAAFAREKARLAAFTAWDHHDPEAAEKAWAEARAATDELHRAQARVATALERAQVRDPDRTDIRRRYADLLFDRALLAADEGRPDQRDELVARLALYDDDGARRARLEAASELALEVSPPEARVELARYDGSGQIAIGSGEVRSVPAGAWLVTASVPGRVTVRVSLLLARGEPRRLKLELPVRSAIPEGFIYMPPGDVLFGSSEPEPLRRWANAVAAHRVHSGGYLIAQHETTFAQWIEFLDQLSPAERERRRPRAVAMGVRGTIELVRAGDGRWQLAIQPAADMLRARWGEPLRYPSRTRRAVQDWRKMPVTGITQEDAKAYAAWLERTQRVPGARLCTEHEWERAARGTSDRRFPHGDVLDEDDANFDATYGKQPRAFGPDEVGSHPKSRSPFGIDDLAGNAWEWVVSSVVDRQMVARGGSYYFAADTARVTNREVPEPSFRGSTLGVRVCATPIEAREL